MQAPQQLRAWWTCDHCRKRACTVFPPGESAQDLADRVAEAHAIAQPDCHALHGDTGLRVNASGHEPLPLWEM